MVIRLLRKEGCLSGYIIAPDDHFRALYTVFVRGVG